MNMQKISYTGASDRAKLERLLNARGKLKSPSINGGQKYTYISKSSHYKNDKLIFETTSTHHIYALDFNGFIRALRVINKIGKDVTMNNSDEEIEYIQNLNSGVVVKEIIKITGIGT